MSREPRAPRARSIVMVEVGGVQYPMRVEPQCHTCMSPYRRELEQGIMSGLSYQIIANSIADREPGPMPHPSSDSLQHHLAMNHMPLGATAERALIDRRSKEIGWDIESHQGSLVDHVAANRIIVQRGMERIAKGEITPSMGDLLRAIQNQHVIEQSVEDGLDSAAWQEALVAYMEVAQQYIPPHLMADYGRALTAHPVLRAMVNPVERIPIAGEVVPGTDAG